MEHSSLWFSSILTCAICYRKLSSREIFRASKYDGYGVKRESRANQERIKSESSDNSILSITYSFVIRKEFLEDSFDFFPLHRINDACKSTFLWTFGDALRWEFLFFSRLQIHFLSFHFSSLCTLSFKIASNTTQLLELSYFFRFSLHGYLDSISESIWLEVSRSSTK